MTVTDLSPTDLWGYILTVPPRARAALILYIHHWLSLEEIGARLGCTEAQALLLVTAALDFIEARLQLAHVGKRALLARLLAPLTSRTPH